MKAPVAAQRRLLDLQAADNRILQANRAIQKLPQLARLAELERLSAEARNEYAAASNEREQARVEISRIEADVETVEAREKRDRDRLASSSSTKDIQGLESELASLAARRSTLEDAELEVMERVDGIEARLAEIVTRRDDLATEERLLAAERDAQRGTLERQREAAASERAAIAAEVPADLLALYERQRERYGIGAALLQRGISLGSNVALTAEDLNAIRRADPEDVVLCPDSSCILVRTEESGL
ncbi:zinc ribbon domain-containing protein [Cnuibacter sp. UC19_7]|uniref:zinc ribbon domain-containing protein n=1 Tax=Cnuibacter sp. UC19_7 TaxID=3350166 RepID=UPI00366ADE0C